MMWRREGGGGGGMVWEEMGMVSEEVTSGE